MSFLEDHNAGLSSRKTLYLGIALSLLTVFVYQGYGLAWSLVILSLPFGLVLSLRFSVYFALLFMLFSYFRIHELFPVLIPLKLPKLFAIAALFSLVWHLLISKKLKPFWHTSHTFLTVFFVWSMVCVVFASNRVMAFDYWLSVLPKAFLMVFAICWWLNSKKIFGVARVGIIVCGIAVSVVAIYNKIHGIGLVEGTRVTISRHLQSQLGDPNDLCLVLLFPVSFLCAELLSGKHTSLMRLLIVIALGMIIYGIIITQSRGGLLGLLAVFGYFTFRKIKNPLVVLAILIIASLLLLAAAGITERTSGGANEIGLGESAMGRLHAWQAAFGMAFSNPLTGVGLNNFYPNYFFFSPAWDGKNHAVHSSWFQVMAEMGVVGLFIYILLVASLFKTLRRCESLISLHSGSEFSVNVYALKGGFIGFIVSGTFLTQAFTWPFYIILAMSVALEQFLLRRYRGRVNNESRY